MGYLALVRQLCGWPATRAQSSSTTATNSHAAKHKGHPNRAYMVPVLQGQQRAGSHVLSSYHRARDIRCCTPDITHGLLTAC